jgi:hypothetical protein
MSRSPLARMRVGNGTRISTTSLTALRRRCRGGDRCPLELEQSRVAKDLHAQ